MLGGSVGYGRSRRVAPVDTWLPEDHLAWFVLDVVGEFDLSEFLAGHRSDGRGGAAYDPSMMVALFVYAYTVGERSSRRVSGRSANLAFCDQGSSR